MSGNRPLCLRSMHAALLAMALTALPLTAHAAGGDPSRWIAYAAFAGAALVVVVMLLREAFANPSDDADEQRQRMASGSQPYGRRHASSKNKVDTTRRVISRYR